MNIPEDMSVRKPTLSQLHEGILEMRVPVIRNELQVGLKGDLKSHLEPMLVDVSAEAIASGVCRRIAMRLKKERPFQVLYTPRSRGGLTAPSSYMLAHEVSELALVSETGKFWGPEPSHGLVVNKDGLQELVDVLSTYGLDRQQNRQQKNSHS